ncbi:MAG: methyltransferase domain-containing protein [Candidatus Hydrogenedentes bacterium]|nr:methyltransferase domain-containing protein [Candidatus Hydrogenedentota bacterium]
MERRSPKAKPLNRLKTALRWVLRRKTVILHPHFTRQVVARYCLGRGCEIGPGMNPQTDPARTIYLDRYTRYRGQRMLVDLVSDAEQLPLATGSMDYLFSSHALEHCPNTLAVLREWQRVLRPGGRLVLRLPHRDKTFDRTRPLTTLDHHIQDEQAAVDRRDETHWDEFAAHAIDDYPHHWKEEARRPDGSWDMAYIVTHGHIHYHVWTQTELIDLLRHLGFRILFVIDDTLDRADSFLIVGEKA